MKKSWKATRGNSTYDTDRYSHHYVMTDDGTLIKGVWPEDTYVGPGAYNSSHVDLIYGNKRNIVQEVLCAPDNPYHLRRSTLSRDKATFKP
jgi:hypothetical protein